MTNQDLVLNIAVNLGRLGRWASENNFSRIHQFLTDTQNYTNQLQNVNPSFQSTYDRFMRDFLYLKSLPPNSPNWADTAFTWAAILTHRAKFA